MGLLKKDQVGLKKKIGILGGTFDPIHNGHLFIAQMALEELQLDQIMFIPNRKSPHKLEAQVTDAIDRLMMTEIATIDNEEFIVSPIEIYREGPSYTIDTVHKLMKESSENTSFYFITGTDVLLDIESWKSYRELLQLINFVVVTRGGCDHERLDEKILHLKKHYGTEIVKINIPNLEISSTDIRERVKAGKSIKYLVPKGVEAYIKKHEIYL